MLPGFRFLFAATLLTVSLLVFGLGAAALLRASHERFANLPKQPVLASVFTQTVDPAPPTLSMLRVEPAPEIRSVETLPSPEPVMTPQFDTLLPTDRIATLSSTPRVDEPTVSPPVAIEPELAVKADITPEPAKVEPPKVEIVAEPPVQIATPAPTVESAPPIDMIPIPVPAEPVLATTPDEPARVEAAVPEPAPVPQPTAVLPAPETTGAIISPAIAAPEPLVASEPTLVNARPIRKPPIPRERPAAADVMAALPDPAASAPLAENQKPVVRKRKPVAKRAARPKRRIVSRPAPQRPAAQNPASPFGTSPFGT